MFDNKESFKKEFEKRVIQRYGRGVKYTSMEELFIILADMVKDYGSEDWLKTKEAVNNNHKKQLFYFSMEFLIGRLLTNNLMNAGVYDVAKEGLQDLGININKLEEVETDAGLGNGGLGRLAACFLDSLASMGLPGNGNSIRYEYGLFKQLIIDNKQVEVPDLWLKYGNPWETRKFKHAVDIRFYGDIQTYWNSNGDMEVTHVNPEIIKAVPYDVPIIGYHNHTTNTLRLWKPEASEEGTLNRDFISYIKDVNMISQNVYPDDSTEEGRMLRIKQEYFFSSAGIQTILKDHYDKYQTFDNLPDKVVIQLNDTHPILIIPELMRILMDEHKYPWDKAWSIVTRTIAYTNHTILQEALERWPIRMIKTLLPRIYLIIEEINRRFYNEVLTKTGNAELAQRMSIIHDGQVFMSNMADATVYSINGVAKLHTEILKNDVMKDFYNLYPYKFNNKTNGITHRRWLVYSNPQLTSLLTEYIGDGFIKDPSQLEKLMDYVNDPVLQKRFLAIKRERKRILDEYINAYVKYDIDADSIIEVQAKRLHAYKRQMLCCMYIIYLYQRIHRDPDFIIHPVTFIFAAKAAPAYTFAKNVIELINCISDVVNADPLVSKYVNVVFVPNYSVSNAEIMMNAADISLQISTAGKEASGTGNMKLMMNGAITLGTLDGANVEIRDRVGDENFILFGNTVEQLRQLRANGYNAQEYYRNDPEIRQIMDSLIDGTWHENKKEFEQIYMELIYSNDEYFHFADFQMFKQAQEKAQELYRDKSQWAKMCLINIAMSGYFSTDRTIANYNEDIWHLERIDE
ncbi:MAG: glycogen/starch/alpha-glucan phosphorylase [Erysipelotrichaceae bacterium]|nr:glycogen/starch/alpha-glucan phosphorylase [Erysipelotrichaceae bacterium]